MIVAIVVIYVGVCDVDCVCDCVVVRVVLSVLS